MDFNSKIEELDRIRELGGIVMVKLDGERDYNYYTIIIDYSKPTVFKTIRYEGSNLIDLIDKAIIEYKKRHHEL